LYHQASANAIRLKKEERGDGQIKWQLGEPETTKGAGTEQQALQHHVEMYDFNKRTHPMTTETPQATPHQKTQQ
jgi:hypothetical protein